MKTITIISILGIVLGFLFILRWIWNTWKDGRKATPDDLLHMLNFKIENCMMDDSNEIYLINDIAHYKTRPDIDKEKLAFLEHKFKERFKILHEGGEFSPENTFG